MAIDTQKLTELNQLLKDGVITQKEFETQKKSIMDGDKKANKKWFQKKRIIIPLVLVFLGILGSMGGNSSNNTTNTQTPTQATTEAPKQTKPKAGDTLEGISREEIDKKYAEANKASKFKADEYKKSLVGQKVTWIVEVQNVDTKLDGEVYLYTKSGIYTTWINDPAKKYTNFSKGDLVKVTGKINSITDFVGVTAIIDPENVEIVK